VEAKDLILSLLKQNKDERLGAGKEGSDNDYKALKNHMFFKDINFETINTVNIPLLRKNSDPEE